MRRACTTACALWADRRARDLSEVERLALEEHLAACARCDADARAVDRLLAATGARDPDGLSPRARDRALRGALAAAPVATAVPRRRGRTATIAVAAAAAAAVGLAIRAGDTRMPPPARPAPATAPAPAAAADLPAAGVWTAGTARVKALAPSAVAWRESDRTIELRRGAIAVDTGASASPLRVETQTFAVRVLAGRFEITPTRVHVWSGTVEIRPRNGRPPAVVAAGGSWDLQRVTAPALADASTAPTVAAAPDAARRAAAMPERASRGDVAALLARARTRLAAGDVDGARRAIERALAARPHRAAAAEARSLLADAALVAGDARAAVDLYLRVAREYPDLPAADNAAFAAARAAARAGDTDRARRLLRAYLDRFPAGRFADDARARLRARP